MLKTTAIILSVLAAGFVTAEGGVPSNNVTYISQDKSAHSQICMAALESRESVRRTAIDMGIGRRELNKIRCNELSVMDFAKLNRRNLVTWSIATVQ